MLFRSVSFGSTNFLRPYSTPSFFLCKTAANGTYEWSKSTPLNSPYVGKITQAATQTLACDADNNVYFAGLVQGKMDWGNAVVSNPTATTTDKKLVFTKIASNGIPQWTLTGGSITNAPHSIAVAPNGAAYFSATCKNQGVFGNFTSSATAHNFVIGKISTITAIENAIALQKMPILYPNPASERVYLQNIDITTIKSIKINDILGRNIANPSVSNEINIENLPKGVYFIQILVGNTEIVEKFIKN